MFFHCTKFTQIFLPTIVLFLSPSSFPIYAIISYIPIIILFPILPCISCLFVFIKALYLTHPQGCEDALTEFIRDNLLVVASVAITFVVAEVGILLYYIAEINPFHTMGIS